MLHLMEGLGKPLQVWGRYVCSASANWGSQLPDCEQGLKLWVPGVECIGALLPRHWRCEDRASKKEMDVAGCTGVSIGRSEGTLRSRES